MIWAAGLMLFFLFVRTIRYRISGNETIIQRYTWYIYYISLALIPVLFLLTCFFIDKKASRIDERLLLIPAAVLALFVLTNDLHYLFFKPVEGEPFDGESGRYATNFMYYIFYAVIVGYFITGIVFVVRALKQNAKKIIMPFLFLGLWGALIALMSVFSALDIRTPYYMPEITIFVMLGVYESCIRGRLFAYNENYEGFFESMNEPALICDNSLSPVYCTSTAVEADSTQLKKSINNSFNIDGDTILKGRKLKSGYAFWIEDESELNRLNKKLEEAGTILASENELRKEKEEIKTKARIYSEADKRLRPYIARAEELLDGAVANTPEFHRTVVLVSALNAFVKRGANLLMADDGSGYVDSRELRLAIEEFSGYIGFLEVDICVTSFENYKLDREDAFNLFSGFEIITRAMLDCNASAATVAFSDMQLRLVADCEKPEAVFDSVLPISCLESDGMYCFRIDVKGGAEV